MKKARSITRPKVDNTRKTLRKQKRQQKKVHRQEHYLKKKNDTEKPVYTAGRFVKRPAEPEESGIEVKVSQTLNFLIKLADLVQLQFYVPTK